MKSSRRLAREGIVQGLYAWQMTANPIADVLKHILTQNHMVRADVNMLKTYIQGIIEHKEELDGMIAPYLDRDLSSMSPIERAILWMASFELRFQLDTPFRVIINEAVEIAKSFGGTDGHKYINGVLDKMSMDIRAKEVNYASRGEISK